MTTLLSHSWSTFFLTAWIWIGSVIALIDRIHYQWFLAISESYPSLGLQLLFPLRTFALGMFLLRIQTSHVSVLVSSNSLAPSWQLLPARCISKLSSLSRPVEPSDGFTSSLYLPIKTSKTSKRIASWAQWMYRTLRDNNKLF